MSFERFSLFQWNVVLSEAEEAGFVRPYACLTHWIYRWIVPEAVLLHIRSYTA